MIRRYGEIRKDQDKTDRKRQFIISTESVDRHGTSIRADAWDLSGFAGAAYFQHSTFSNDPDDALGPARVWREGSTLVGEIDFEPADINPKADKVLKKLDNGTYRNASVGFIAHDGRYEGEGEDRHFVFTKAELTEFSVVGIPSNKDAKMRDAEAIDQAIRQLSEENGTEENAIEILEDEIRRIERDKTYKRLRANKYFNNSK